MAIEPLPNQDYVLDDRDNISTMTLSDSDSDDLDASQHDYEPASLEGGAVEPDGEGFEELALGCCHLLEGNPHFACRMSDLSLRYTMVQLYRRDKPHMQ